MQKPNFEDFNLINCTLSLDKSKKKIRITKLSEVIQTDEDGKDKVTFVEDSKKEFKLSHIESVVFGPMQSRMWMFRKAINSIPKE